MTSQKKKLIRPKKCKRVNIKVRWHQDTKNGTSENINLSIINN